MNLHFSKELRDSLFKLDPRSMLAFRTLFSVALLVDLIHRFVNTKYFFTESGVFPKAIWEKIYGYKPYYWSFHFNDVDWVIWTVVGAQVVLAVCVVIGYRLRTTLLISWIFLLSMNLSNPLLTYGGDKLSPGLLPIAGLLPLTFAQRKKAAGGPLSYLGGLLILTQMTILYIGAGEAKVWQTYWMTGDALHNALNYNLLVKPFGVWFSQFDSILKVLSLATPWAEIILPMLFWVPSWGGRIRAVAILGVLGLNFGIFLMLDVGYFMFYASPGLICLLPPVFWDSISPITERAQRWLLRPGFSLGNRFSLWVTNETKAVDASLESEPRPLGAMGRVQAAVMVWLVVVIAISGLEGMHAFKRVDWPKAVWNSVRTPNLYQNWGLFSNPDTNLMWYVGKAELNNGKLVDIIQGGESLSYPRIRKRPSLFVSSFRWRLAFAKANKHKKFKEIRQAIAANVARKWNDEHSPDEHVKSLKILKMSKVLSDTFAYRRRWKLWATWDGSSG